MTRDEARAYFTTSGLTYSIISKGSMARLKIILDREMSSSGLISGSFITDRVPELVEAVRANEVPVEYIVFPDEGHGFTRKSNRITASEAYVQFLDRYLK